MKPKGGATHQPPGRFFFLVSAQNNDRWIDNIADRFTHFDSLFIDRKPAQVNALFFVRGLSGVTTLVQRLDWNQHGKTLYDRALRYYGSCGGIAEALAFAARPPPKTGQSNP
jgi:hypothetical protein